MDATDKTHVLLRGSTGWVYVVGGVIIWDFLSSEDEQLTRAFRRGYKTRKIIVTASWLYLTGHLFGYLPDEFDIIHHIGLIRRSGLNAYRTVEAVVTE